MLVSKNMVSQCATFIMPSWSKKEAEEAWMVLKPKAGNDDAAAHRNRGRIQIAQRFRLFGGQIAFLINGDETSVDNEWTVRAQAIGAIGNFQLLLDIISHSIGTTGNRYHTVSSMGARERSVEVWVAAFFV